MTKAFTLSAIADADLSAKKGYVVKLLTTNVYGTPKVGLCDAADVPFGILTQPGNADEDAVSVAYLGYVAEAKIGDTVTQGQRLKVEDGGMLVPVGANDTEDIYVVAMALKGGADGDLIPVVMTGSYQN